MDRTIKQINMENMACNMIKVMEKKQEEQPHRILISLQKKINRALILSLSPLPKMKAFTFPLSSAKAVGRKLFTTISISVKGRT